MMSFTRELTMPVKAAPMTTATARSTTLPRRIKSRNPFSMQITFDVAIRCHATAQSREWVNGKCFRLLGLHSRQPRWPPQIGVNGDGQVFCSVLERCGRVD